MQRSDKTHFNKELVMAKEDNKTFKISIKFWICDNDMLIMMSKYEIIVVSLENIDTLHIEIVISILN